MATEFKKDPVLILRIDGEDLKEFTESTQFEAEAISIFSKLDHADESLHKCLTMALEQLSVDHGMPPSSDPWVYRNVIEPAIQPLSADLDQPISQETFLEKFKKLINNIVKCLHEHPVIVAHSENTFDGTTIRRLLSNKFELNKLIDDVWRDQTKDQNMKQPKEYLLLTLERLATPAELPPYGTNHEVDAIVNGVVETISVNDCSILNESDFEKTVINFLESLCSQLAANPIVVSSNLVIDEPLVSSSPASAQSD